MSMIDQQTGWKVSIWVIEAMTTVSSEVQKSDRRKNDLVESQLFLFLSIVAALRVSAISLVPLKGI